MIFVQNDACIPVFWPQLAFFDIISFRCFSVFSIFGVFLSSRAAVDQDKQEMKISSFRFFRQPTLRHFLWEWRMEREREREREREGKANYHEAPLSGSLLWSPLVNSSPWSQFAVATLVPNPKRDSLCLISSMKNQCSKLGLGAISVPENETSPSDLVNVSSVI